MKLGQPTLKWLGVGVTALVALPLIGLLLGLIDPIPNPLLGSTLSVTALLAQPGTLKMLWNTLALALASSFVCVLIGTWLAFMQARMRYPLRQFLGLCTLLPLAMPSYLLAATLREALGPTTFWGKLLPFDTFTGFFPAFIVLTLISVPFVYLLVNATLARSSSSEEEAARILGANPWQVFRTVIVPRLRPSFAFALLIAQLYVISDFGAVAVLDFQVLTWRLYQAVDHQMLSEATLLGVFLLVMTLPLLIFARNIHGHVPHRTQVSNARPPKRKSLKGIPLCITYLLHGIVLGIGVILPIVTLMIWVYHGVRYNVPFASLSKPLWDTFWVTGVGAIVVVFLSFFPAWFTAHHRSRLSNLIEQGTYISSALPGVLLAFGLMLFTLFIGRYFSMEFYSLVLGSGVLLMLGYTMRFLAEAYAPLKAAILMLDVREKESAKLLGASEWCWFKHIALPALRPGVMTAFVLMMLAIIKELPVTLLLGGAMGVRTLSFRIFDRYQEAFLHDAGLTGLVLLCFSFVMTFILLRWRRHVT